MSPRKITSAILREFNKEHELKGELKLHLKHIDQLSKFVNTGHDNDKYAISKHYSVELNILDLILSSLGALALASATTGAAENENRILHKEFSGSDIHLCGFLTNICNTAVSAIKLVKQGFDTQARILVRTLDERMYQCLVLFFSSEDYNHWDNAEDQDEAKQAHYSLFGKKNRLLKKVQKIEDKYLGLSNNVANLSGWRKEMDGFYSMAVHGSSAAVLIGSASFSFEDDSTTFPNIFGAPSSASGSTLSHIIFQMYLFLALLPEVLEDIHEWQPNVEDYFERVYMATNKIAIVNIAHWLQLKRTN